MSKVAHTPGPWAAGRSDMQTIVDGVGSKWVYGGNDEYVAVASGFASKNWATVMANAHLIAAAPELLEALEYLLISDGCKRREAEAMARAAVAKARGMNENEGEISV